MDIAQFSEALTPLKNMSPEQKQKAIALANDMSKEDRAELFGQISVVEDPSKGASPEAVRGLQELEALTDQAEREIKQAELQEEEATEKDQAVSSIDEQIQNLS